MPNSYTDAQRTAALDAVDALIDEGEGVAASCRQVGKEQGIPAGTLKSWRSKFGRAQTVADKNEAAAVASKALVDRTNEAIDEMLDLGLALARRARDLIGKDDRQAADTARAANSVVGTMTDKNVKLGRVDGAERVSSTSEVTIDVTGLSDEELAKLAGRDTP